MVNDQNRFYKFQHGSCIGMLHPIDDDDADDAAAAADDDE